MKRRTRQPEGIKDVLKKVINKIEDQGPEKKETIVKAWASIVGDKAAGHSKPTGVQRNVLTIEVDSSSWLYNLNLKKRAIVKDIKSQLKKHKIEDIRFRIG